MDLAWLEDQIVHQAVARGWRAISAVAVLGVSSGVRPGRGPPAALEARAVGGGRQQGWGGLEADIPQCDDTLEQHGRRRWRRQRRGDHRRRRLSKKGLGSASIDDRGDQTKPAQGLAQGLGRAPLLSQRSRPDGLDLWRQAWRTKRAAGAVSLTRCAEDSVRGCQDQQEAARCPEA